jgi:hypothetical protein
MTAKLVLHDLAPATNAESLAPISCADILNKREQPVALFTPALMITHGHLDRDPVVAFNAYCPANSGDQKPFIVDLQKDHERFFEGLGVATMVNRQRPVNFDKRLYAIDTGRAEECFEFLSGISFADPATGFFAQTCAYDIKVPDPTSKIGQMLDVRVFGVVANDFVALLQERTMLPPIAVKFFVNMKDKSDFLRKRGIVGIFDGDNPLQLRD